MDSTDKSFILQKIYISSYSFILSPTYEMEEDNPDHTKVSLMHRYEKIDDTHAREELRVVIGGAKEDPYSFSLVLGGLFEDKALPTGQDELEAFQETAIAILFPYLRSSVTNLTTLAGVNGCVLPIINVRTFFQNNKANSAPAK